MASQRTGLASYPLLLALVEAILMTSCASCPLVNAEPTQPGTVNPAAPQRSDPLEHLNRLLWQFNYTLLDPLLYRPMAVIWNYCLPRPLRQGISNALGNLDEVPTAINYLLQARFTQSLRHVTRFAINTFGGLGGLVDIASYSGLPKNPRYSLGHVLGYYRVDHGPYLMLPGYGPTTPRHLLGQIPEQCYYFPIAYLTLWGQLGKGVLEGLEKRAQLLSKEAILQQSSDSYLTVREAYFQRQDFIIKEQGGRQGKDADRELSQDLLEQLD